MRPVSSVNKPQTPRVGWVHTLQEANVNNRQQWNIGIHKRTISSNPQQVASSVFTAPVSSQRRQSFHDILCGGIVLNTNKEAVTLGGMYDCGIDSSHTDSQHNHKNSPYSSRQQKSNTPSAARPNESLTDVETTTETEHVRTGGTRTPVRVTRGRDTNNKPPSGDHIHCPPKGCGVTVSRSKKNHKWVNLILR